VNAVTHRKKVTMLADIQSHRQGQLERQRENWINKSPGSTIGGEKKRHALNGTENDQKRGKVTSEEHQSGRPEAEGRRYSAPPREK